MMFLALSWVNHALFVAGQGFYDEEMKEFSIRYHLIGSINAKELAAHILMERIYPKEVDSVLLRNGEASRLRAVCEMGIYSTFCP